MSIPVALVTPVTYYVTVDGDRIGTVHVTDGGGFVGNLSLASECQEVGVRDTLTGAVAGIVDRWKAAQAKAQASTACGECAGIGCAKCDPGLASANHLAWALDQITPATEVRAK